MLTQNRLDFKNGSQFIMDSSKLITSFVTLLKTRGKNQKHQQSLNATITNLYQNVKRKRQKITNRSFSSYAFQAVLAIQGHTCEVNSNFTEMDLGNCFPSKYFMIYLQDILVDRCNIITLY